MGTVRINSVVINNASTSAGFGPFYNNRTITNVDLGQVNWTNNSMYNAFRFCNKLNVITNIPESIVNMECTFNGCTNLVNAPIIPNSVTTLASTFSSTNLVNAPVIPNSVTNMYYTFGGSSYLKNAPIIPDSVITMASTFGQCKNLINVPNIGNYVTALDSTFYNCIALSTVPIIPSNISSMVNTFRGCQNLTGDIYIYSPEVVLATNCFNETSLSKNVYIPYNASLGIYSTTYNSFNTAGYKPSSHLHGVTIKENPSFEATENWWWCNYDGRLCSYLNLAGESENINLPNTINGVSTYIHGYNTFKTLSLNSTVKNLNMNNVPIKYSARDTFVSCSLLTSITNVKFDPNITEFNQTFARLPNITTLPELPDTALILNGTYRYSLNSYTSIVNIPNSVVIMNGTFMGANFRSYTGTNGPAIPNSVTIATNVFQSSVYNKEHNFYAGENITNIVYCYDSSNIRGNFYIRSNKITDATGCFGTSASFRKNVYIPFTYKNGSRSATYSAFLTAGYKTTGAYANVYLYNYTDVYSEY